MKMNQANYTFLKRLLTGQVRVGVSGALTKKVLTREFGSSKDKLPARPFLRPALLSGDNLLTHLSQAVKKKNLMGLVEGLKGDVSQYLNERQVNEEKMNEELMNKELMNNKSVNNKFNHDKPRKKAKRGGELNQAKAVSDANELSHANELSQAIKLARTGVVE